MQVEFSNVVVVNKGDLVNEDQKADIIAKISLLNPKAKVVESIQSKVKMSEILNTHLFKAEDNKEEFWMSATKVVAEEKIEADVLECCETRRRWQRRAKSVARARAKIWLTPVCLRLVLNPKHERREMRRR